MSPQHIHERYRIEGRLGIGGMSTVHRAFDTRLEREVAIKLLAEHLAEDETFVSRFRREALAAARLVHPNIVQVFDFGLDDASGQHFIVMELVNGPSCAQLLRDRRSLGVDETLEIVGQSSRGLDHAHRNGVVHRDVKPGNLLFARDEHLVKLADFGIARATEQSSITQVGSVLGTAAYLAPEQARGEEAGPAADIYSMAVVTYQLMAGRLPYEATSLSELTLKQQREAPTPLDAVNPEVPPSLARAVARGLAIDPKARYESAVDFAEALNEGARGIDPPMPEVGDRATEETRMLQREDDETAATRVLGPMEPVTPARPVSRAPERRVDPEAARPRAQRKKRSLGRVFLVVLLLAGLVGAGAIIAADELGGKPQLRRVAGDDAQQVIDDLKKFIEDNTQ